MNDNIAVCAARLALLLAEAIDDIATAETSAKRTDAIAYATHRRAAVVGALRGLTPEVFNDEIH